MIIHGLSEMKNEFRRLMRRQVQEKIDPFVPLQNSVTPPAGWIRVIRDALGISTRVLAKKIGCSQSNIITIEKNERDGTISLNTLTKAARALNCKLVYCLVPEKPLNKILEERAREIATKHAHRINHSMKLEGQGLSEKELNKHIEEMAQELTFGNLKNLWSMYKTSQNLLTHKQD